MAYSEPRSHKARDRWHASELPDTRNGETHDPATWLYQNMVEPEEPQPNSPEKENAAAALLNTLSPAQREAVELCIMQGMSHGNAADLLGISVNAVDQRLCRARRIMKRNAHTAAAILGIE